MNFLTIVETPPGVEFGQEMGDKGPEETSSLQPEEPMSTSTKVVHTNGKSEKGPLSQSSFIRNLPKDMPVEEVIRQGKLHGMTITRDRVTSVRRLVDKAKKPKNLKAIRKAAGQKAAATKAARKNKKRKGGRKAYHFKVKGSMDTARVLKHFNIKERSAKSKVTLEAHFLECVIELGTVRSQELLDEVREIALRSV